MSTCVSASLLSFGLLAGAASAQLVVGNDQTASTNPTLWLIDPTGIAPARALASGTIAVGPSTVNVGTAWGAAADESGRVLYWNNGVNLFSAPYATSGELTPTGVTIKLAGTPSLSTTSVTGLAFDTVEHKLYGFKSTSSTISSVVYPVGFYEIEPSTGLATLVLATPGADYGGFDYDVTTDSFYALNDAVGGPGRGLVRISKPLASASITHVAPYPGTDSDIDGLAVGSGVAFLVNDVPTQNIEKYDLANNTYLMPQVGPFTATGALFAAGAWAPGLSSRPPECGNSDFNGDGDFGTDADIEAFFACLAGNCCPTCFPGGADFNMDGDTGTDADIESFFRVLAGGVC